MPKGGYAFLTGTLTFILSLYMAYNVGNDWVLILGHPVEKHSILRFLILSALCLLVVVGMAYYVFTVYGSVDEVEPLKVAAAEDLPDTSVEFSDPLKALIARYRNASGYGNISGFLIRGNYQQEGLANLPLLLMGRHPGLYKQVLSLGEIKVESGYADGAIWGNAQQTLPTEGDTLIAKENRLFLLLQLSIPALAWLDLSLPLEGRYELLPDTEWQGRPVSVIRNVSYEEPILHYLDANTALELRRVATVATDDGGERLVELIFGAPEAELPFAFPSGYECLLDGNKVNSVKFTKYEFDKWLPDILFERKESPALAK
jgi:hypothetical protein